MVEVVSFWFEPIVGEVVAGEVVAGEVVREEMIADEVIAYGQCAELTSWWFALLLMTVRCKKKCCGR